MELLVNLSDVGSKWSGKNGVVGHFATKQGFAIYPAGRGRGGGDDLEKTPTRNRVGLCFTHNPHHLLCSGLCMK
jgi:hypothetical protein